MKELTLLIFPRFLGVLYKKRELWSSHKLCLGEHRLWEQPRSLQADEWGVAREKATRDKDGKRENADDQTERKKYENHDVEWRKAYD